jgi:hypothetical protein
MRQWQYTVTRHDAHRHTTHRLRHLRLPNYGRRCTAGMPLAALLTAAARLTSLFAAARRALHNTRSGGPGRKCQPPI